MPPPRREPSSGLFALFQPAQIKQFREAFQLIDADKDGEISGQDLARTLASLGIAPPSATLDQLVASGPVTFTTFLTMMSDRLVQFDPESDLLDAFECFDDADTGIVKADELRRWLADVGERMDAHQIDKFLGGPFTDRHGNFSYREWIKVLRINDDPVHTEQ